jgi:hypothetical protein
VQEVVFAVFTMRELACQKKKIVLVESESCQELANSRIVAALLRQLGREARAVHEDLANSRIVAALLHYCCSAVALCVTHVELVHSSTRTHI